LHLQQRFQDAVVLVMEARLIAVEQCERASGAGEGVESDGEAVIFREVWIVLIEAFFLIQHAMFEEPGFDACVTRDAPMGGGELMDEIAFGLGLGAEMIQIVVQLGLVFVRGFIEEDDGAGGEPVGEGVEGGGLFAGGGGWATGLGTVGAGGGDSAGGGRHGLLT
jgi:hypothetical protein